MKGYWKKLEKVIHKSSHLFILLTLVVAFAPREAQSFGSWNQETTARELCFLYTLTHDWQQTLDISKNPGKYKETNPFLGDHPDEDRIHLYFAGCALTHALVAYMLPPKYSRLWQVSWIGIQSKVTDKNKKNGLDKNMEMEYRITFSIPF